MLKKVIFVDRDGTLIAEPEDCQVDAIAKLTLQKNVILGLRLLRNAGFSLVMVTNQDGLGNTFKEDDFMAPHLLLLNILNSQDIFFDKIYICPHVLEDKCFCRKPNIGLVLDYLKSEKIDFKMSYMIGDRESDLIFGKNIGVNLIQYNETMDWLEMAETIINQPRVAEVKRLTTETEIILKINLDQQNQILIETGIGFFDHMLTQMATHGGFSLVLHATGDLHVDDHHTVEDVAIVLGKAINNALSNKWGIERYGFTLPMDDALAAVSLDLSGRYYFHFEGSIPRETIGGMHTEMIPHFFRTLAENIGATLHIKVQGINTHHMIESIFKCVGRALKQAIKKVDNALPSTKGVL